MNTVLSETLCDVEAVSGRKHHVEDNQIKRLRFGAALRVRSILRGLDVVAGADQEILQGTTESRLVLHQKNAPTSHQLPAAEMINVNFAPPSGAGSYVTDPFCAFIIRSTR